ncbi:MAG: hypothetical protein CL927_14380 [Deltaproteobacteria bacterium]|nr:hypothetical protein [Deltaproteobacteria bacterium]HCH63145.1 hypothetical protein [Deltaproteobacteria bacterium]
MTAHTGRGPSGRAYRRMIERIRHREVWSAAELEQLDQLYERTPKIWWHLRRVVRQQVKVCSHAHAHGMEYLITAPVLEELAFDDDPDALAAAIIVVLDVFRQTSIERRWTSLREVLCALLRQEDVPLKASVEAAPIDPGPAFTALLRRVDLRAEGLEMGSCIGDNSWWRQTVNGRGFGYAVRRGSAHATVWVAQKEPNGPYEVMDALGPRNAALEPVFRDWITAAVDEVARSADATGSTPPVSTPRRCVPAYWKRLDALEQLGNRLGEARTAFPPPAKRKDPSEIRPLRGLPPVHWVHHFQVFRDPPIWRPSEGLPRPAPGAHSKLWWDDAKNAVIFETREGRWTLHAGLPLRLDGPETPANRAPFLWMDAWFDEHDPSVSGAVRRAQDHFLRSLPESLRETCAAVDALRGMPGIWLLSQVPRLAPVLTRYPFLVGPVLKRAWSSEEALQRLPGVIQTEALSAQLDALLEWLGIVALDGIRGQVHRMQEDGWSLRALRALERIHSIGPSLDRLLARVHRIRPAHAVLIDGAARAGLHAKLTPTLLSEVESVSLSPRTAEAVETVFAALESSERHGGSKLPRLRSLGHVARLLVERRQPVPVGFACLELAGPWGEPARSVAEVAGLAANLGCDPEIWKTAAHCGWLVFAGVPLDVPTVSWIQPSGLRGSLRLASAHTTGGQSAPQPVLDVLAQAVAEHNQRIAGLPAGWSAAEAKRYGLPAGLATLRGGGQFGTGELVFHLLDLRG